MKVQLKVMTVHIERHDMLSNSNIHNRMKDVYAKLIGKFFIDPELIPQVGWIIRIHENDYVVKSVIYEPLLPGVDLHPYPTITLEVSKHSTCIFRNFGSGTGSQFHETIPLCIDLPIREETGNESGEV